MLDNISVQRELAVNYYKVGVRVFVANYSEDFDANWEFLVHQSATMKDFTDAIFTAMHLVEVNMLLLKSIMIDDYKSCQNIPQSN